MHAMIVGVAISVVAATAAAADLLIVADEIPAMEYLAQRLQDYGAGSSRIVTQEQMPVALSGFRAVLVYIHRELHPAAERAMIHYTTNGGRLVVLHHSISSGKRKNKEWFAFLGVNLPPGDLQAGGYKWIEGVKLDIARLEPGHFITTNAVTYPGAVPFQEAAGEPLRLLGGFHLDNSEVYLNHVLTEARTLLLGFRYEDTASGKVYCQNTPGWLKPAGQGWIIYLLPGHSQRDFEAPAYSRIIANATLWKP